MLFGRRDGRQAQFVDYAVPKEDDDSGSIQTVWPTVTPTEDRLRIVDTTAPFPQHSDTARYKP